MLALLPTIVICLGYHAVGPDPICEPQTPSQKSFVQDLVSANLRFKRSRIANLWLINLSAYIYPLAYRDAPKFQVLASYYEF
jgi:hypothetical protein